MGTFGRVIIIGFIFIGSFWVLTTPSEPPKQKVVIELGLVNGDKVTEYFIVNEGSKFRVGSNGHFYGYHLQYETYTGLGRTKRWENLRPGVVSFKVIKRENY